MLLFSAREEDGGDAASSWTLVPFFISTVKVFAAMGGPNPAEAAKEDTLKFAREAFADVRDARAVWRFAVEEGVW